MKQKTGRKPLNPDLEKNRKRLFLVVETETLDRLTNIANHRGWILTEYIRDVLRNHVREVERIERNM